MEAFWRKLLQTIFYWSIVASVLHLNQTYYQIMSYRPPLTVKALAGVRLTSLKSNLNDESSDNTNKRGLSSDKVAKRDSDKKIKFNSRNSAFFASLMLLIVFGSNFLGSSSFLLSSSFPEYARNLGLDEFYPINNLQRYVDRSAHIELLFPADWMMDRKVLLANAQTRELPAELYQKKAFSGQFPLVAFTPRSKNGLERENISVIRTRISPDFSLSSFGSPKDVAENILRNSIAPANSGKFAELISASEDYRAGILHYTLEYSLRRPSLGIRQHTISVVAVRNEELFTYTSTIPEEKWKGMEKMFIKAAKDFKVLL